MLRKIKTNLKNLQKKESSLMDFIKDFGNNIKIKSIQNIPKSQQKKLIRSNDRYPLRIRCEQFNGLSQIEEKLQIKKKFTEDKENLELKNNVMSIRVDGEHNSSIKNYFKPLAESKKIKKIDFFDELNMKNIKMPIWEEKDLEFPKSKILPKVKIMKVDNDVMTDEEQVNDAFKMMRDNLREAMKLINQEKDYLSKNLSKKIKLGK
jgi:hypothetical protein